MVLNLPVYGVEIGVSVLVMTPVVISLASLIVWIVIYRNSDAGVQTVVQTACTIASYIVTISINST